MLLCIIKKLLLLTSSILFDYFTGEGVDDVLLLSNNSQSVSIDTISSFSSLMIKSYFFNFLIYNISHIQNNMLLIILKPHHTIIY